MSGTDGEGEEEEEEEEENNPEEQSFTYASLSFLVCFCTSFFLSVFTLCRTLFFRCSFLLCLSCYCPVRSFLQLRALGNFNEHCPI